MLWLLLVLFILIALLGFNLLDPLPKSQGLESIKNYLGILGAWTAGILYDLFGVGVWLVLILSLMLAGKLYYSKKLVTIKQLFALAVAFIWVVIPIATLLGLTGYSLLIADAKLPLGGTAGLAIANSLSELLGLTNAYFLVSFILLLGLFLAIWSIWPFYMTILNYFKKYKKNSRRNYV